jgi:hypothetical protein
MATDDDDLLLETTGAADDLILLAGGSGGDPPALPPDRPYRLLGAIRRRVAATPALAALISGGVHRGLAPAAISDPADPGNDIPLPTPYVELYQPASPVVARNSGPAYLRAPMIRAKFYGDDEEEVVLAIRAWEATFNKEALAVAPLDFIDGTCLDMAVVDDAILAQEDVGPGGRSLHVEQLTIQALTGHTPPVLS